MKLLFVPTILAMLVLAGACSQPADEVAITETSTRSETRPVPRVNASSDERFVLARPRDERGPAPSAAQPAADSAGETAADGAAPALSSAGPFAYEIPPGWQPLAPTEFRDPNFVAGPSGEVECYVSVLRGSGGGLLVNANRWRGQMGRAPYSEEEFARLPRATVLGQEAVIVDFGGDFSGMGAAQAKPGYRLIGALIQAPDAAIFIKMTGPEAQVEAEKDHFAVFAQSLRMNGSSAPDPIAQAPRPIEAPAEEETATAPESGGGYSWSVPEGWTVDAASSPMRLVTLRFGADNAGECYVAVLPGAAGGRLENFNRWLGQMGQPPLEESELDLQPTVFMFDEEVPMLISNGTYTGMGGESRAEHVMFGSIASAGDDSVFVKLIAPEAIAKDNLRKFQTFCASLKKS